MLESAELKKQGDYHKLYADYLSEDSVPINAQGENDSITEFTSSFSAPPPPQDRINKASDVMKILEEILCIKYQTF